MSDIYVCGLGAVSPAGWSVPALREALERGHATPARSIARPGWDKSLAVRSVPAPVPRPAFLAHARLRRASAITQFAVAATLEALGAARDSSPQPPRRLGLVMCTLVGCAQYSQRFFDEVLTDPATASPLIFPETVFNAPASHIAAVLGVPPVTSTLIGDPAMFGQGLSLAADWLLEGRVDGCVVVGAEEASWLLADVLRHFDRRAILSEGAGAVYLGTRREGSLGVALEQVTDPQLYGGQETAGQAAARVRQQLPPPAAAELLCDSLRGSARADAGERVAWSDWPAARCSPKRVLGESLTAAAAWQCVAACDALSRGRHPAANVSIVGPNQQAIGARFVRCQA
jgi:3-oxoacyl-(acyl-carrier-protein) synthase